MVYDIIIIGGGPAAAGAAVYVARKKLKGLLIAGEFGGQSIVSADVQNWIGTKSLSGFDLAKNLEAHVRNYPDDLEIKTPEFATKITKKGDGFLVQTDKGGMYETRAIIYCAGARRRKLGIPGEAEFDGKGVAYCSTCDAPLFNGKDVVVVGGGNAGLEAVVDLLPYANKIYLMEYADALKGDPVTQARVKNSEKVEIILNAETKEVKGEKFVTGLAYKDRVSGDERMLSVGGIFVEIGSVPNSEPVKDLVMLNKYGEVLIDHKTAATSQEGIWAAGDVTDEIYKQNNISVGDGVKAALSAYQYLLVKK